MAKRINYMKKNHVSCQIHTLFYVVPPRWNWILKTLYIINTFQASSAPGFLLRPVRTPWRSKKLFARDIRCCFNLTLARVGVIQLGAPPGSRCLRRESEEKRREVNHTFHLSHSVKEPRDEGLRGRPENTSVAKWGEKNTHGEFSYPLRLGVLGRGWCCQGNKCHGDTLSQRNIIGKGVINIFLSDAPNGICKEVVCALITVETPVMNPHRLTFRAAQKNPWSASRRIKRS